MAKTREELFNAIDEIINPYLCEYTKIHKNSNNGVLIKFQISNYEFQDNEINKHIDKHTRWYSIDKREYPYSEG